MARITLSVRAVTAEAEARILPRSATDQLSVALSIGNLVPEP